MSSDNPNPAPEKGAVELLNAITEARNQLLAASKHEEREDRRLALYERQVDAHAEDVASAKVWREQIVQIEQERNKHFASMAESLRTMLVIAANPTNEGK